MKIRELKIKGCFEVTLNSFVDERGNFIKTFNSKMFKKHGFSVSFKEEYYSYSKKGVLRGLHFHMPPYEYEKIVYCAYGKVFDAIVDLRVGSSTYGRHETLELSERKGNMLYLSKGIAHGFYVNSKKAIIFYKVTSLHSKEHDAGILWDSAGIPWPDKKPIMSERDSKFVPFKKFNSPFKYKEK